MVLGIALAVLIFFGFALFAVHAEEKRRADRRQQDIPVEIERRLGERRKGGSGRYLKWALRTLWSKFRG